MRGSEQGSGCPGSIPELAGMQKLERLMEAWQGHLLPPSLDFLRLSQ